MKIPSELAEKWAFYNDLSDKCVRTQKDRTVFYNRMRNFYLYGYDGSSAVPCKFNKIYPHLDSITSFLYSQETTRFATQLGVSVSHLEYAKVGPINQGLNDEWHNSEADIVYGTALIWALVYGSTFVKPRWKVNGIESYVVDPHNFGVLREDSSMLSSQEAFTHDYYITMSQLRDELEAAGPHPRRESILSQVAAIPKTTTTSIPAIERIITSAASPVVIGNAPVENLIALTMQYSPKVAEPLVRMRELYVFDSSISDYRVVTLADPYVLIYDRPLEGMFLKNDPPFIQVCPLPTSDYFYGLSEVERLASLQELLNQRWNDLTHMMALQAHPPKSFTGFQGISDEIGKAFDVPDGSVVEANPGAKVESFAPKIPEDLFADVKYIESMFEDTSGINNVMSGKGEAGVRSSGHASQLARLGSSRVKKRAMIIEDSLEQLATMYLKLKRKYDPRRYKEVPAADDTKAQQFTASQFTDDFMVKVDGHSNSPIFVEDQTQIAFELLKVGAITKERLLQLITVPMRDQLIQDLKEKIEPAEREAQKQERQDKLYAIDAKSKNGAHPQRPQ
jgi:hypothetical protein